MPAVLLFLLLSLFLLVCCAAEAEARVITELPLRSEGNNDWVLPAGEYVGQFLIDETMTLRCEKGAVIQARGQGHALNISAPNVVVDGCILRDWGRNLTTMDSGIFLQSTAVGVRLQNNFLKGPGFGIWVDGAPDIQVMDNIVEGDVDVRSQDRGNGIHLFSVKGGRVSGNQVRHTRDGIYIDNSRDSYLEGNILEDLRYGVHYMFSHDNHVSGNITRRTRTGYALMQSRKLTVVGNRSEQDENYGILMNNINYSIIRDNFVSAVSHGSSTDSAAPGAEGKALFIYNSLFNTIENNHFEHSTLGIHLTAGSEDNRIVGNAFVDNRQQVKYVATRTQEWSADGRGNYWSDYLGWDRDGNGLGDLAYEPNDNVDRLLWMYPQVRLLMNSPAIQVLRWVQRVFPVVRSPGVKDSYPLMRLPTERLMQRSAETAS